MDTTQWKCQNGVYHLSKSPYDFETPYIRYRKKEGYVLSDAEVSELPKTFLYNLHRKEWELRSKSVNRLLNYLKKKGGKARILDLGCGNGWVSNKLAHLEGFEIFGLDINLFELEQAVRVFPLENLKFCYGNVYESIFEDGSFDYVIIGDAIPYFSNLQQLINRCRSLLKGGGEIHIFDSAIHVENQIEEAREQMGLYFEKLACSEMMDFYYFHTKQDFSHYDYEYLYSYGFFNRLLRKKDSPYPWIKIIN
ncbi:MAG: class I SAM-dependent methyltransferase [Bacteroidota bacterium]